MLSADKVIGLLGLKPHPEGGHYAETFRDTRTTEDGRAASTAIYFLLKRGEWSWWHRVDAVEIWHWYAGETLELSVHAGSGVNVVQLGPDLSIGERPQAIVPAGAWQKAKSLGDSTLCGCTVAPGFEFSGFELAPKDWEP